MKIPEIELPSNRKFGFFFTFVFSLAAAISLLRRNTACEFYHSSIDFSGCYFAEEHTLLPLNKLWMRFGFLLGIIVSPIVLG